MLKRRKDGSTAATVILALWGLFCFLPILFFATIALRPRNEIIAPEPIYFPTLSIGTWAKIWAEWPIANYFSNSMMAISGSVLICLVLGIPAAYSLARYRYKGREDIGFYILSTKMMAPAAVAIPIFVLFGQLRMLDTVWALMLVYAAMNLSIVVWIIRSYMLDIPHEIEDAARTAGNHHGGCHCCHLRHERVSLHPDHRLAEGLSAIGRPCQFLRRLRRHYL
jgi:multiple sugar transport system permease protein